MFSLAASFFLSARPASAGTEILRESYAPAYWDTSFANAFSGQVVAQSFVAHSSFLLTHLELYLFDQPQSSGADVLQVSVAADAGGHPGTVLASAAQQGSLNWSWVDFRFSPWFPLNVTQRYWILASDSEPRPKGYEWAMNSPGDYVYGEAEWSVTPGVWTNGTGADLFFRLYGLSGPSLTLEVEPSSMPVNPGATVPIDLWFNNSGNEPANTADLSLSLDPDLSYLSDDASSAGGVLVSPLAWAFNGLAVGTHHMTVWVQVATSTHYYDGQSLLALAGLNYTDSTGAPQATVKGVASVTVLVPVVRCSATPIPAHVSPGQTFNYTVSLINLGSGRASEVWVNASVGPRVTLLANDAAAAGAIALGPFEWRFDNVSGQAYAFNITARASSTAWPGDRLSLFLSVTYTDGAAHLLASSTSVAEAAIHGPSLVVSLAEDGSPPRPSDTVHLAFFANNTGDSTAARVWINASFPSWTAVESSSVAPTSASNTSIGYVITSVAPGPFAVGLSLAVSPDASPGDRLTVAVHLDVEDASGAMLRPSAASSVSEVTTARFELALEAAGSRTVQAGDRIDLVLRINNTGNEAAPRVWVNLTLPTDTLLVNSTLPWTITNGTTYAWSLTGVDPGALVIGVRVEVSARITDRESLVGRLALSFERADGVVLSASAATIQFQGSVSTLAAGLETLLLWLAVLAAIFLLFLLLSLLDVLPHRRAAIDDVFLLHNSGVLICHYSTTLHPDVDSDIASGMLVAVRNFVADALKSKDGALEELRYGDYHIHMAHGQYAILVVFTRGVRTRNLDVRMQSVLRNIETLYGKVLEAWSGRPEDFKGVESVLLKLVSA